MGIYITEGMIEKVKNKTQLKKDERYNNKLIKSKIVRDDLLILLKDLQSSKIIEKTLNSNTWYKENRKFILDNTPQGEFYGNDKNSLYPNTAISELIRVLEKVKDGNPDEIDELVSGNKYLTHNAFNLGNHDEFLNFEYIVFMIIRFARYINSDRHDEIRVGVNSIIKDIDNAISAFTDKYKNSSVIIKPYSMDSYYYVYIQVNNKNLK